MKPTSPISDTILDFAISLCQQRDFDETLRLVTQQAIDLFSSDSATVVMLNPQTRQTIKTVMRKHDQHAEDILHKIHVHVTGWVLKNKSSFVSDDLQADERFSKRLFKSIDQTSVLAVQLCAEGVTTGVLILVKKATAGDNTKIDSSRMTRWGNDGIHLIERFAAVVAPHLRNVQEIQRYFSPPANEKSLLQKYRNFGLLGKSKSFIELLQAVEAASRCDVRVLLEGESGTGKEKLARAIHMLSARSNKPFVAIDCGAIPPNLVESELFGHIKGAFTGATTDRKGLFAEADSGTLFMDEIASLPIDMQAKLMRVLQEGEIRPVGSNSTRQVDVRVITACSTSIRKLVDAREFREDLYYRLHVYPIPVPSLQERQQDVPILANHFLKRFAAQQHKQAHTFHEELIDFMRIRTWPGNIRELENFVERLVTLCPPNMEMVTRSILPKDLLAELKKSEPLLHDQYVSQSLNEALGEHEEKIIRQALARNNFNQAQTARQLKISAETLRYKLKKLGIVARQS